MSFAKTSKNICENISKNLSCKYSQKLPDHAKKYTTDALKTNSEKLIQKTTEAAGDLIGNKIADKIANISRNSQNSSEAVTNETENIVLDREICISRKKTGTY